MDYPWYTIVDASDNSLDQGDLFTDFPALELLDDLNTDNPLGQEVSLAIQQYDVIVLSQSCDLQHDKLNVVLLSPVFSLEAFAEGLPSFQGKGWNKNFNQIRRGEQPRYHMLNQCDLVGFEAGHRVVSFAQVFALPLSYVRRRAEENVPRVRLLPPYREHFAQAFARFIMRVGLPYDIEEFR